MVPRNEEQKNFKTKAVKQVSVLNHLSQILYPILKNHKNIKIRGIILIFNFILSLSTIKDGVNQVLYNPISSRTRYNAKKVTSARISEDFERLIRDLMVSSPLQESPPDVQEEPLASEGSTDSKEVIGKLPIEPIVIAPIKVSTPAIKEEPIVSGIDTPHSPKEVDPLDKPYSPGEPEYIYSGGTPYVTPCSSPSYNQLNGLDIAIREVCNF